jgi:hypothetical protein
MPRVKLNFFLVSESDEGKIFTDQFKMICFVKNPNDEMECFDRVDEVVIEHIDLCENQVIFGGCLYSSKPDLDPKYWDMISFKDRNIQSKYSDRDFNHLISLYTPDEFINKFKLFPKEKFINQSKKNLH